MRCSWAEIVELSAASQLKLRKIPESALYNSNEAGPQHESVHETLTLLLTGEKLRVPLTQRHSPMTEDMQVHAEHAEHAAA